MSLDNPGRNRHHSDRTIPTRALVVNSLASTPIQLAVPFLVVRSVYSYTAEFARCREQNTTNPLTIAWRPSGHQCRQSLITPIPPLARVNQSSTDTPRPVAVRQLCCVGLDGTKDLHPSLHPSPVLRHVTVNTETVSTVGDNVFINNIRTVKTQVRCNARVSLCPCSAFNSPRQGRE